VVDHCSGPNQPKRLPFKSALTMAPPCACGLQSIRPLRLDGFIRCLEHLGRPHLLQHQLAPVPILTGGVAARLENPNDGGTTQPQHCVPHVTVVSDHQQPLPRARLCRRLPRPVQPKLEQTVSETSTSRALARCATNFSGAIDGRPDHF
jgi:hypothetical protein